MLATGWIIPSWDSFWSWHVVMHAWNALPWFLHMINISSPSRLSPEDILGSLDYPPQLSAPEHPLLTPVLFTLHYACLPTYLFPQLDSKFLKDGHCIFYLSVPST